MRSEDDEESIRYPHSASVRHLFHIPRVVAALASPKQPFFARTEDPSSDTSRALRLHANCLQA